MPFIVVFHSFDEDYLRALTEGDAVVESHFTAYFGELLSLNSVSAFVPRS